jgi:hypothetical protein
MGLLKPGGHCRSRRLSQFELHRPLGFSLDHHGSGKHLVPMTDSLGDRSLIFRNGQERLLSGMMLYAYFRPKAVILARGYQSIS